MNPHDVRYVFRHLVRAYLAGHGHKACLDAGRRPPRVDPLTGRPSRTGWGWLETECTAYDEAARWAQDEQDRWRLGYRSAHESPRARAT